MAKIIKKKSDLVEKRNRTVGKFRKVSVHIELHYGNGTIMMASIHNLVELASDNARERIECAQMELSDCSDVLQRLHKFEEKLLPNIESLDDCFLY